MPFLYDGPCVVIGGAPRSGTTLLGAILADHPHAAVLLEERLTDVVLAVERLCSIRTAAEEAARTAIFGGPRSFLSYPLRVGEDEVERLVAVEPYRRRFARLLTQVFESLTGRDAPVVLASKLPIGGEWEDLRLLARRLGDLRVVLVVRNPLDVVSSSLVRGRDAQEGRDEWPIRDVDAACAQWLRAMRAMHRIAQAPPGPLLLVKYEDLWRDPSTEEARIRAFAGLEDRRDLDIGPVARPNPPSRPGLSADDLVHLHARLGDVDAEWPGLAARAALDRYGSATQVPATGERLPLADDALDAVLASGFSHPESWGRWTDGGRAVLSFRPIGCASGARLRLHVAMAWAPAGQDCASVRISVNDGPPSSRRVRAGDVLEVDLSPRQLRGTVSVTLVIDRPKTCGDPPFEDPRALGVALSALSLHSA